MAKRRRTVQRAVAGAAAALLVLTSLHALTMTSASAVGGAAAGDLDPTFGTGGLTTQFPPGPPFNYEVSGFSGGAVATDAAGRFVMAGSSPGAAGDRDSVLTRFTAAGQPDTAGFNGGATGIESDQSGTGINDAYVGVGVGADGSIYTAAAYGDINADAARVRVEKRNAVGAGPAAVFVLGGGGAGLTSVSGSGLVLQPDGKVLVSGSENVTGGHDFDRMWVVRLNADLTLDTSFGTSGTAYVSFGASRAVNQSLALQPDGSVLVGGHIRVTRDDTGVARLTPGGMLDTSFGGGDGIALWDVGSSVNIDDHAAALSVAPDGRIAVGGGIFGGSSTYHVSLLSSAGSLVGSFASSGVHRGSGFALWPGSLTWDSTGRILVGSAGGAGFNALRLDGNTGALDTAFGDAGLATAPCPAGAGVSGTVAAAGGDRIVVLGACEERMMLAGFVGAPAVLESVSLSISEATATTSTPPGASAIAVTDIPASAVPLDALSDVAGIPLRSVDLAASPLRSVPLRSVPLRSVPLRSVPLRSVLLSDIPLRSVGAWDKVLATLTPNPFAGVPLQSITLDQVLDAFDAQPGATGLSAVTLSDVDLGSTPLRSVTMASIALGSTPLRSVPIEDATGVPSGEAVFAGWCNMLSSLGYSCEALGLTADSPILALDLASVPLRSVPLRSVPLRSVDLTAAPLRSVPLRSVNLAGIPLGTLPLSAIGSTRSSIVDCSKLDCATRTLADAAAAQALVSAATLGALFDAVTDREVLPGSLLELLQGLINVRDYPWEKLPLDAVGIADFQQDGPTLRYQLDVAMTGAGAAPSTAVVTLPAGFRYVRGSSTMNGAPLGEPTVSANVLTWQLGLPGGSTSSVLFDVRPGLDLGDHTSSATVTAGGISASATGTAPVRVVESGELEIVGECMPSAITSSCTPSGGTPGNNTAPGLPVEGNTLYISHIANPGDIDYYSMPAPPKGTRIQVQLGVPEGADLDVAMFNGAQATPLRSVPLRSVPLRSVPLPDQGLSTDTGTLSPETLQDIPTLEGIPLRSVSENRSDSEELIDTTSDAAPTSGQGYTLQVSGFNGSSSTKPYVLYIKQYAPPTPPTCPARTFAFRGEGVAGAAPSDLGTDRETLFLVSPERLGDTYGQAGAQAVVAGLGPLAARADVKGLVYPVEGKPAAASALGAWDADPCKPDLANAAFRAVATIVDDVRAANPGLKNVVVVGGDDLIPMARVADYTQLSNESDYASSVLKSDDTGTPIAAALASENILTDDPLGVSAPIAWLDHQLYVPDVAVGRLVESPEAIVGQIEQYIAADGLLDPKTSLTTGYDFLSDGAGAVDSALSRIPVADRKTLINETWSRTDLNAQLFPTGGAAPDIATVNAHYDHNRSLPAQGNSTHDESDLFTVADIDAHPQAMISRILFTMGCHAGLNVPDAYLDPADPKSRDWAQTYLDTGQKAAVYLANTGYGYGDTATIALSEQLMQLFAERLDGSMTVGQAAAYAKQAYFGQLGAYGPYDEKAMQEATFYGLPMYRIGAAGVTPPATATVTPSAAEDGVSSLPVSVESTFTANTSPGGGTFYTVGNEAPQVTQYRPIVPRTSRPVTPSDPAVGVAHGFLTTSLVSRDVATVPAVARPVVDQGANEPPPVTGEVAFPTSFSNLTTFSTLNGPEQRLVVLPGQVFRDASWQGAGAVARLFDKIDGEVKYSTSDDFTAPFLTNVSATLSGSTLSLRLDATDASGIATVLVLVKDESGIWRSVALTQSGGTGPYIGSLTVQGMLIEYFAQAQDTAGNVGISTNKGRYYSALLPPVSGEQPAPPVLSTTPVQPTGSGGWYRSSTAVTLTKPVGSTATYTVTVDGATAQAPVVVTGDGLHTVRAKGSDGTSALLIVPIDSTNPTVTVGGVVDGGAYPTAPRPTCEGVDATSGIAICTVTVTGGAGPNGIGTLTATATAYDRAGRSATTSVTYTAGSSGFLQPINDTGHTINSTTSVFKAASTIPVKFQILDPDGEPIELATPPVWLEPERSGRLDAMTPNEVTESVAASTGPTFTYDPATRTYSYNWRTKKDQGGYYWKIAARLSDGTVYWTYIGLR